jgi:hypothetical protein
MKKLLIWLLWMNATIIFAQEKKFSIKDKYVNYTELGGLFGKSYQIGEPYGYTVQGKVNVTIQTFNGIKVYKNLAIGATLGVDWFSNFQIVPIALGLRNAFGDMRNKKVKPFVGIDAGYGFMWLNESSDNLSVKGGLAISPSVGLLLPMAGNANFTLSIGYKHNDFSTTSGDSFQNYYQHTEYNFNRMVVKLGVNF